MHFSRTGPDRLLYTVADTRVDELRETANEDRRNRKYEKEQLDRELLAMTSPEETIDAMSTSDGRRDGGRSRYRGLCIGRPDTWTA